MTSHDDIFYQKFLNNLSTLKTITKIENESDTRLRAIDTIVFDVLSWEKKSVDTVCCNRTSLWYRISLV